MKLQANTSGQSINKLTRGLGALLMAAAFFSSSVFALAAEINYDGGSGGGAQPGADGDVILIGTGGGQDTYSYSYTLPDGTGTTTTITFYKPTNTVSSNITINNARTSATYRSAMSGEWAILQASYAGNAIIRFTEPTSGGTRTFTFDNIIITNTLGTSAGAGIQVQTAAADATALTTIAGNMIFRNNYTTNSGGGVQAGNNSLTFSGNVVFDDNRAGYDVNTGGWVSNNRQGGAINFGSASTSTLIFEQDAVFLNNKATQHGGALYFQATTSGSVVFKGNAVFEGNRSGHDTSGTWKNGQGGALWFGADTNSGNLIFEQDAMFKKNSSGGHGGAMYFAAQSGTLQFKGNVVFEDNQVGVWGSTYNGGAVWLGTGASIVVEGNATFKDNSSSANGGALYTGGAGDGTYTFNGDTLFLSNTSGARGGAADFGNSNSGAAASFNGKIIAQDNTALGGAGGAFNVQNGRNVYFNDQVLFTNNLASTNGGAIYLNTMATLTIVNTTGASVEFRNNAATTGGAINTSSSSAITINTPNSSVKFINNAAHAPGGGAGNYRGGAIAATSISITGSTIEFTGNQAGTDGGAIYTDTSFAAGTPVPSKVFLTGVMNVSNNISGGNGGAIFSNASAISTTTSGTTDVDTAAQIVTDVTVTDYASGNIYLGGSGTFANNAAGGYGGAIYVAAASGTVTTTVTTTGTGAEAVSGTVSTYDLSATAATTLTIDATTGDITFTGNTHGATIDSSLIDPAAVAAGAAPQMTASGGSANDIYFAYGGGTLALNTTATTNIRFDGGLASADAVNPVYVVKNGAGSVTFDTAASTAKTITVVNAGIFRLANNATYGAGGTFTLAGAGATLMGKGTMLETVTANAGSFITIGGLHDSAAAVLNINADLFLYGATIDFDVFGTSNLDQLIVTGNIIATDTNYINILDLSTGVYTLITAGNFSGATAANFALLIDGGAPAGTAVFSITDNKLVLNFTAGAVTNTYNTWAAGSGTTWQNGNPGNWSTAFANGDKVTFTTAGAGAISIASAAGVRVAEMIVDSNANYTFTGPGGIRASNNPDDTALPAADASGKLIKDGAGTLAFENTGANTFAGGVELNAGTLSFTNAAQLDTTGTAITFTGDATLKAAADAITLANTIKLDSGVTATIDTQANNLTLSGAFTAPASSILAKTGAGTLSLTADNSAFAGATQVQQGAINLVSGATLGGSVTVASGAALTGIGTFTGAATINGGILAPGVDATTLGALTFDALTLNNATLQFDLVAGNLCDQINVNTPVVLNGLITVDIAIAKIGIFDLGSNLAAIAGNPANYNVTIGGMDQIVGGRQNATISGSSNGHLYLEYITDSSRQIIWAGPDNGAWDTATVNWKEGSTPIMFATGDRVIFDATAPGAGDAATLNVQLGSNQLNVVDMWVQGDASYTFQGAGGITADAANVAVDQSQLGGVPAAGQLVKDGAGTLTFENTGTNIFAGGIVMKSGTLGFNAASQITTPGAGITFAGDSTLLANADGMTIANDIAIADGVTATIDTQDNALRLTGALTGGATATFMKTGTYTLLTLAGDNSAYAGKIHVMRGSLQIASPAALGTGELILGGQMEDSEGKTTDTYASLIAGADNMTIANPIRIGGWEGIIDTGASTLTLTGPINGNTLAKTGSGILVIASPNNAIGSYANTDIRAGAVQAAAPQALSKGSVIIASGAALRLEGYAHQFSTLTNDGALYTGKPVAGATPGAVLTVTGDYHTGANSTLYLNIGIGEDNRLITDHLKIIGRTVQDSTDQSGATRIVLLRDGQATTQLPGTAIVTGTALVTYGDNSEPVFTGDGIIVGAAYYTLADNGANGISLLPHGWAPNVLGMLAIDASSLFMGKAANESISRRFAALRANDIQTRHGINLWLNGLAREDKVTNTTYDGAKSATQGIQAGVDFLEYTKGATFALGGFFSYMTGDVKVPGGARTKGESTGGGIYGQAAKGPWHVAAMFRVNTDTYTISSNEIPVPHDIKGTSWGASIEGGYDFKLANHPGWVIEPQAALALHRTSMGATSVLTSIQSDPVIYKIDTVQSTTGRLGIKASKTFDYTTRGHRITPWVRLSAEQDIGGECDITVGNGDPLRDDLGGATMMIDAGVSVRINNRFDFSFDAAWYTGAKYNGYSLNAGLRLFW